MTKANLKPCPFCGDDARTSAGMGHARCSNVFDDCPLADFSVWIPVEAWNRRSPNSETEEGDDG